MGSVPPAEIECHLMVARERMAWNESAEGQAQLHARLDTINRQLDHAARERLVKRALTSRTAQQRVHWLRREADLVLKAAEGVAACRQGCTHCCHISVQVPEAEAQVIAKAIGRRLTDPAPDRVVQTDESHDAAQHEAMMARQDDVARLHEGVPCPFLADGSCSIYEHRPMACRHLVNVDVDDLLCRLVPGQGLKVPYLNTQSQKLAHVAAMGLRRRIADLRDWFPTWPA